MWFQGTLRVLLVLLHDFPEFLCEYSFDLCNMIPPSCVQLRNLILSAFPRHMRLPDPFTPQLKVDLLPDINDTPSIRPDPETLLVPSVKVCFWSSPVYLDPAHRPGDIPRCWPDDTAKAGFRGVGLRKFTLLSCW